MSFQRRVLRIRWFHRVTNAEVTSQTEQEDLTSHIRRRRAAVFGHVRRLPVFSLNWRNLGLGPRDRVKISDRIKVRNKMHTWLWQFLAMANRNHSVALFEGLLTF